MLNSAYLSLPLSIYSFGCFFGGCCCCCFCLFFCWSFHLCPRLFVCVSSRVLYYYTHIWTFVWVWKSSCVKYEYILSFVRICSPKFGNKHTEVGVKKWKETGNNISVRINHMLTRFNSNNQLKRRAATTPKVARARAFFFFSCEIEFQMIIYNTTTTPTKTQTRYIFECVRCLHLYLSFSRFFFFVFFLFCFC